MGKENPMSNKYRIFFSLVTLAIGGLVSGCPSIGDECDGPNPHQVQAQAFFSPGTDSLKLGDTLYLRCSIPKKVALADTRDSLDLSEAKGASAALALREIIMADKSLENAWASFDFVSWQGSIRVDPNNQRQNTFQQLAFRAGPGRLELEVGLVPRNKGIYSLVVIGGVISGLSGKEECGVPLGITVENPDPHLHYLKKILIGDPDTVKIPNIHYLFKVY